MTEVDIDEAPKRKLNNPEMCPYPSDIAHLIDEESIKRQKLESESTLIILNKNGEGVHVKLGDGERPAPPQPAAAPEQPPAAPSAADSDVSSSGDSNEDDDDVVEVDPNADTDVEIEIEPGIDDATFAEMAKAVAPTPN